MNRSLFAATSVRPWNRVLAAALATGLILLIPFTAMRLTDGVLWTAGDFLTAGALLFPAFLGLLFIATSKARLAYRLALLATLGATFLMTWANLAVGLIGAGGHWGNWLYAGVLAIAGIGAWRSRLGAAGMTYTQFAAVGALALITILALAFGLQHVTGSSAGEIMRVNGFFAALFLASGLLFRRAARQ